MLTTIDFMYTHGKDSLNSGVENNYDLLTSVNPFMMIEYLYLKQEKANQRNTICVSNTTLGMKSLFSKQIRSNSLVNNQSKNHPSSMLNLKLSPSKRNINPNMLSLQTSPSRRSINANMLKQKSGPSNRSIVKIKKDLRKKL